MMTPDLVFKDESVVVYSHTKSNYTIEVLYINMRHKFSSVNVPKEFILFVDEAQLLGDDTEPARLGHQDKRKNSMVGGNFHITLSELQEAVT